MQATPRSSASKTQSLVNTPFRSLLFNDKLYILKPSPAEIETFNKDSYILHYAGHNVRPDADFEDIFEFSYPSSNTPLVIFLHTDEAINQFIQGNGLQNLPPLTSSIKEAEIANYLTNYKIIYKDVNGQLVPTEYTIMMHTDIIRDEVKNAEAKIYITLEQADIWRQGMNYKSRYEATQIQEYRDLILSEAELLLKNEVNPLVDIFRGEGKVLVMGKNNAPPASLLSEIGNRNALGFRQSRVICGDTGVLTW